MLDKIITASECPEDVALALTERGISAVTELTITEAMEHWSAWNLGDPSWGRQAANLVAAMNSQNNLPT